MQRCGLGFIRLGLILAAALAYSSSPLPSLASSLLAYAYIGSFGAALNTGIVSLCSAPGLAAAAVAAWDMHANGPAS